MKNKILRLIPLLGVGNVVVLIIISLVSIWTMDFETFLKTSLTCLMLHFIIMWIEAALKP